MALQCDVWHVFGNKLAEASARNAQAQSVASVQWGTNFNILPSTGTNPITIASSPKGFFGDIASTGLIAATGNIESGGTVKSAPASGAAILNAVASAGQDARMQLVETGGATYQLINRGVDNSFVIDRNDAAGDSPNLKISAAGDLIPTTDGVTGASVTPNGTIKWVLPDGTVKWLLTSATQN
jgi:hypothetical protein